MTPPPALPPVLNSVDVVTFPDGVATPAPTPQETPPVQRLPTLPTEQVAAPKAPLVPKLGPKPTDRRTPATLSPEPAPIPVPIPVPATPQVAKADTVPPRPAIRPLPIPAPTPTQTTQAVPVPRPVPVPVPVPAQVQEPISVQVPVLAFNPVPITIEPAPPSQTLAQPAAEPLNIRGSQLKLRQAATLKPVRPLEVAAPLAPTPVPSPQATPPTTFARPPSPPPPAFVAPKTAPLTIPRAKAPLPKVQVPRIAATDLRLPEVQVSGESAAPPAAPSGVTSVSGGLPSSGGSGARSNPSPSGLAPSGSGSSGGPAGQSGTTGGGNSTAASGTPNGSNSGASGPTGILPRRPGGASVRQPFPTGDNYTLVGKMDKIYDCSRLNRERDARCPNWDPIEGRNSQGAASMAVPEPKGLPKLRNPIGTNPLPLCPPGTPGNQMGLSCLPSREGPGIPRP
jgi:hypothetical protein